MGNKKDIIGGRDTMKKGKFVMSIILVFTLIISQINTCYGSNDILSAEQIKDDELEGVLADYIFQNLNKFYELEDFDINNVKTLSETVAAGISTILGGEFTLLNVVFLIGPMFRYTFSSFIKQTSLVVLGTSLNGRYIDRMMIDEDL